jgi:hypothetical protein
MKALTWLMFVLCLTGRGVQIAVHLPPFLTYLQSFCASEIPEHIIENHYQGYLNLSVRIGIALPSFSVSL